MATGDDIPAAAPALVTEGGVALVERGEVVLPAAGSEAQAEQVLDDARATVQYYFPVEVEVRAAPEAVAAQEIVDMTLDALAAGLADA
jgi:hypothetical protein